MALYHTYRPQRFADIVDQHHIVQTIMNQLASDRVAHAYLFSGPRGVGKTTTARVLAKAINCSDRKSNSSEPCNTCASCQEISGSRSIDVIEIDAASHTGVDNVRENIIENAQFRPTKAKYKVFIVDEVHMLSASAFNALLKTLEEPPPHVIFILATTEKHKLPETVISRCQRFDFKKIPYEALKQHLEQVAMAEGVKVNKDVIDRIINKSDGSARDAVSLLDQIMATGEKNITAESASIVLPASNVEGAVEFVSCLVHRELKGGLEQITKLANDGINLSQFAHDTIELLRVILVTKANPSGVGLGLDLSDKVKQELKNMEAKITNQELVRLIDLWLKRRIEIKSSPLPQLPLELAVVEWCANGQMNPENTALAEIKTEASANESQQSQPADKPTLKEKVKQLAHQRQPAFTVDQAKTAWTECIKRLEADSPALVFILKTATLTAVDGHHLHLAVPYSFYQDKLSDKKCQKKLETILSERLKTKVKLYTEAQPTIASAPEDTELKELVAALEGDGPVNP